MFEPVKPKTQHPPLKITDDVYLIQQTQEASIGPLWVYLNSLVINGPEPIIVDTGTPVNREQWMKDVFSIVDPGDVRWIFLSHDDVDHSGNLAEILEACPNAKLVVTWFFTERHGSAFEFPLERCLWINDGDSFRAGNRTLTAITPPLFDSPVTRGLYDDRTGVYWAVDSFATPLPGPMDDIAELDPGAWKFGLEMFNRLNSPWFKLLDQDKFERHVDRTQRLEISTLAACHSPVIRGSKIGEAFDMIRKLPQMDPAPQPGQPDLDALMHAVATGKQYIWEPPAPGASSA
jgi:flavorubredoxin